MSAIPHVVVYGMTQQGKGVLVKALARRWLFHSFRVLAYNPLAESDWPKGVRCVYTADQLEAVLQQQARTNDRRKGMLVVDEAFLLKKQTRERKHKLIPVLGNIGRHLGYSVWAMTQFPTAVDYALRLNCAECFCFALGGEKYAKMVWEDWNYPSIDGVPVWKIIQGLKPFECVHITRHSAKIITIQHLLGKSRTRKKAGQQAG